MSFAVKVERRARKTLRKLNPQDSSRIVAALESLEDDPAQGHLLTGNLSGLRSLRVGEYRVIYQFSDGVVRVPVIEHRRSAYKRRR